MKTQITRAPSRRRRRQRRWPLFLLLAAALVIAVGFPIWALVRCAT